MKRTVIALALFALVVSLVVSGFGWPTSVVVSGFSRTVAATNVAVVDTKGC